MVTSVIQPTPSPLLAALEENLHGHVAFVHRYTPDMTVWDTKDLLLVDSGLVIDNFNRICRARMSDGEADRHIGEALGYFRSVQRPFAWWVGPCSRSFDLEKRLTEKGLRPAEYELGMAMELKDLPRSPDGPGNLTVRRVETLKDLADAIAVFGGDASIGAFYRKAAPLLLQPACPMRLFVGYLDGEPAATSELFLGGGVAGVYAVGTLERFRGKSIGSVLTWTAASKARREGVTAAILQASDAGQGVYARLGFRACCRFCEYALA